jgi:hypothetical protein
MSKQRINVKVHGISSSDKQKEREIKKTINAKINELNLAYNKCSCNTCRVTIINQLEEVVNAELFYWFDNLLTDSDTAIDHIIALNDLIERFNNIRKELLNS